MSPMSGRWGINQCFLSGDENGLARQGVFGKGGFGLPRMIRENAQIRIDKVELTGNLADETRIAVIVHETVDA
jgi:hypothetical protein